MKEKLEKLQEVIGYQFKDPGLLTHALTHSSYANEKHWDKTRCNERLEFLGDAVLEVIPLGDYLLLGKGEDLTGGRKRPSVVSDAMEAVIGAIYLDGGLANAKEFIHRFILNDIEHKQLFYDSKTILQEMVQAKYKETLVYELLKEEGPDHNKSFEVCVKIGDEEIGRGLGRTKKAAEQVAAYHGICKIQ